MQNYLYSKYAALWGLAGIVTVAALDKPGHSPAFSLTPAAWAIVSMFIWLAYAILRPDDRPQRRRVLLWGISGGLFLILFLANDPDFRSWGDVYFFCGSRMQYCTCSFRWNSAGWCKAIVLWNFVLTTALGIQRLIIQLGLCGLLPGEEVVTREGFISICWRLIPYFLNAWEQQWGAECSSMMFELPHFAVELLIILPCVQILCSRMKVLAMPSVNLALPPGRDGRPEVVREEYVPNVLRGCWERQPEQRHIWQRIRANKRIIAFSCLLCLMAGFNALYIPLHLEDLILTHPDTALMQVAGRLPDWHDAKGLGKIQQGLLEGKVQLRRSFVVEQAAATAATAARQAQRLSRKQRRIASALSSSSAPAAGMWAGANSSNSSTAAAAASAVVSSLSGAESGPWQHNASWAVAAVGGLLERVEAYKGDPRQCPDVERLRRNLMKHHEDIFGMQDPEHRATIPLVEIALALMRLSTEKFFVLLSLYVAFLVFRVPPCCAAWLISLNARISGAFARLILYSFPAVCWVYGAGFVFSTFVSVVFWGGPLMQLYELMRSSVCRVTIKKLRRATAAEIERMHGDCAICWCEMTVAPSRGNRKRDNSSSASNACPVQQCQSSESAAAAASGSSVAGELQQQQRTSSDEAVEASALPGTDEVADEASKQQQGLQHVADDDVAAAPAATPTVGQGNRPAAADNEAAAAAGPNSHSDHEAAGAAEPTLDDGDGDAAVAALDVVDAAASAAALSHGYTLPCSHAYHHQCLNQWLQQCHIQAVTPTCPMCQSPLQLNVQWHLLPWTWGRQPAAGAGAAGMDGRGAGGAAGADAPNNYLLEHNPRLAELLADMPQILAQENVQLFAEVQDMRHQRQQLVGELQLRQQQLQVLAGRQQQMELEGMEMEQQRRQLVRELQLLRRARDRQRQLQRLIERQQQQRQDQQHQDQQQGEKGSSSSIVSSQDLHAPSGVTRQSSNPQHLQQAAPLNSDEGPLNGESNAAAAAAAGDGDDAAQQDWQEQLAAGGLLGVGDLGEGMNLQRFRQLELLLDAFIREQELAASRAGCANVAVDVTRSE